MSVAYVDSSVLVSIRFDEAEARSMAERVGGFDELVSSSLLEAEFRAALAREGQPASTEPLAAIRWVLPGRPLSAELERVLRLRYMRGANAWHLAAALSIVGDTRELTFLTLDERQRAVAEELGFRT